MDKVDQEEAIRSPKFGRENLTAYLVEKWSENGFDCSGDVRPGIEIAELVEHSRERNDAVELPYVDLWVRVLDECVSWFVSLDTIVYGERAEGSFSSFEKSISLVTKKIIADSLAIRHLILTGYDTASRLILRSLIEYLQLFVALVNDPDLADDFIKPGSPENSQIFWERHIRGGRLRKKTRAAWTQFMGDSHPSSIDWWSNWGRNDEKALASLSHPSWAGGYFSAITPKVKYVEENWLGIWGDKADISADTVSIYVKFVFPILLLFREFPFKYDPAHLDRSFQEGNEFHWHVQTGRDVLASLILSLMSEGNSEDVLPEFDYSFLPPDLRSD